ncbi:MAG TPA: cyclic lactone autoinducer peptide [Candidatus Limivivens intestinipullorum]|uniref:Cyclic lactone autoinducer peptide n=1 Tax=Candidatus Limivivens intestinipullorum TaxID=2840858 RepID=A0A9D1ETC0_9FIRM|nr:cyclic lactone autoinducer peptide [Candidatus Limivivens intestinipullorum]
MTGKRKDLSELCLKALGRVARKAAQRDANTCCPLVCYQPPLPEAVQKLKKK